MKTKAKNTMDLLIVIIAWLMALSLLVIAFYKLKMFF